MCDCLHKQNANQHKIGDKSNDDSKLLLKCQNVIRFLKQVKSFRGCWGCRCCGGSWLFYVY